MAGGHCLKLNTRLLYSVMDPSSLWLLLTPIIMANHLNFETLLTSHLKPMWETFQSKQGWSSVMKFGIGDTRSPTRYKRIPVLFAGFVVLTRRVPLHQNFSNDERSTSFSHETFYIWKFVVAGNSGIWHYAEEILDWKTWSGVFSVQCAKPLKSFCLGHHRQPPTPTLKGVLSKDLLCEERFEWNGIEIP